MVFLQRVRSRKLEEGGKCALRYWSIDYYCKLEIFVPKFVSDFDSHCFQTSQKPYATRRLFPFDIASRMKQELNFYRCQRPRMPLTLPGINCYSVALVCLDCSTENVPNACQCRHSRQSGFYFRWVLSISSYFQGSNNMLPVILPRLDNTYIRYSQKVCSVQVCLTSLSSNDISYVTSFLLRVTSPLDIAYFCRIEASYLTVAL